MDPSFDSEFNQSGKIPADDTPPTDRPNETESRNPLPTVKPSSVPASPVPSTTSPSLEKDVEQANDQLAVEKPQSDANGDSDVEAVETSRSARRARRPADPSAAARSTLYFFLTVLSTFFALWFVGPRLVEEYYYAAEIGRARAEYENAVEQLDKAPLNDVSLAYQLVAQRIKPSVVSIVTFKEDGTRGIGSGVVFSELGHIVTNAHVAQGAERYRVELHNRHVYPGELIGLDSASDLAVIKIDAPNLIPARWGDSDAMDVGSIVWAIGSPFGFQQTITSGVLSGKDRPGDRDHRKQSLLQTDAAVNPGNSGGPLVDAQGRVIGINMSIFGETFQGISFAVPSSTAKFVYQKLVESGKVERGYLGVYPQQVDQRFASILKLPDLAGAWLSHVEPDTPAWQAGIRRGDIIREWNGKPITDYRELYRLSESTEPNTEVKLTIYRNGKERQSLVTMGILPKIAQTEEPSEFSRGM
ncbi:MAG: trypsin-like peptidase domain-containing protein [Planctomycetota bacterium]